MPMDGRQSKEKVKMRMDPPHFVSTPISFCKLADWVVQFVVVMEEGAIRKYLPTDHLNQLEQLQDYAEDNEPLLGFYNLKDLIRDNQAKARFFGRPEVK